MTEIATAYISVIPEVNKGIQAAYSEAAKGGQRLGEALGSGISTGVSSGLDTLRAKAQATSGALQKAARDMAAAQKTEADAAGALRVAVLKLNEARESSTTKTSALAAAEERVAKAQRTSEAASKGARDTVERHESAVKRAESATKSFADAQDNASKKTKIVGDKFQTTSRDIEGHAGAIGGFADKVKGYIGVMAGVAAGAALFNGFKDEARESQKVTAITASIIQSTGGTAKISAEQINTLANAISNKTGVDDEAIQTSSNLLLTFKNVANQAGAGANIFDRATAAAVDLSKAGFGDMDSAAKMLGKALNDPIKGLTALGKAGVTFSDAQKMQIKDMVRSGDVLGAQKIILQEVESQVGGVAAASATAGEKAATTWKNFQEELGNKLLPILDKVAAWFTETAVPALSTAGKAIEGLFKLVLGGDFTGSLAETLGIQEDSPIVNTLLTIRETVIDVAKVIGEKMSGAFGWAKDHLPLITTFAGALVAINVAMALGAALAPVLSAATAIYGTVVAIVTGETTLWAAAQNLLNKAFLNNPIGWIIVAIIAIVAAVIYAWNNFETFRNVVTAVWEGIQTAVGAVVGWFQTTVWPVLQEVFKQIAAQVTWLWQNIIEPAFSVISTIIGAFIWFIQNVLWPAIQITFAAIGAVVTWLWKNIIAPVFGFIGSLISAWWNATVKPVFDALKAFFENVIAPIFGWLWHTVIEPAMNGIKAVFQAAVDTIGVIWNKLKELAKAPVDFVVNTIINNGLINGINTVAEMLGIGVRVSRIPWPPSGWAGGGWTGPGGKYDPAGVVHADEFVIKKRSRRSIEATIPGLLDAMNRDGARALGYAAGGRVAPVPGGHSGWGSYLGHTGLDFPVPTGTKVVAFLDGIVDSVKSLATSFGTHVILGHASGLQSIYAHLSQALVNIGQTVTAGQQIGLSGSTGNSTGPHLHFELRQNGRAFDPTDMLNGAEAPGGGILSNLKDRVVNFFRDNITSLLEKIPGGPFRDVMVGGAKKLVDAVADFFIGKAEATDLAAAGTVGSGSGAEQWRAVASTALSLAGQPQSLIELLLHRIQVESGGNPNAINNWDSNAKAGHPSQGLMQTIPSTFLHYAGPLAGRGITDPLANIYAAIMYTNDRYRGNFGRAWSGTTGYAEGGLVEPLLFDSGGILPMGVSLVENRTGAPEPLARVGAGGMTGLRIEGTLDTPWGPSQIRGLVQSELRDTAQVAAMSRRY